MQMASSLFLLLFLLSDACGTRELSSTDCPAGCLCPTTSGHVSCENAAMTEVPRTGISPSVTSLDFSGNQLLLINSGSLSALRNIVRLKLNNNEISKILEGAFESMPSLQTLDLSSNNLTQVHENTFRGAESLLHIDLSDNYLSSIDGAFSGLRELSRLDLRSNRLTEITQFTFRDQNNLLYLLLSDNHISFIDRRAFRHADKLTYLVLRNNPLSTVDRFQFHSLFLSYVDLSECQLSTVPRGLPSSIRYLQLRRNNLTTLHQTSFIDCPYVSILVLDENNIVQIDEDTFQDMIYLQQLWLNHNILRRLTVRLPSSVKRLLVESNQLLEVSRDVFPVKDCQLTSLSLAGNNLPELPASLLTRLSQLRLLDVSVNNIRRIYSSTFINNTRLHSLQLSRNPIEYLYSGCFEGLSSLRQLAIAFVPSVTVTIGDNVFQPLTLLTVLDMDSSPSLVRAVMTSESLLSQLSSVHELGLLNSHLTRLRPEFADYFRSLVVVRLSSTRWHCDAQSAIWLRSWISTTGVEVIGAGEIRCMTPIELRGRAVLTLADWELRHSDNTRPNDVINFGPVRHVTSSPIAHLYNRKLRPGSGQYWSTSSGHVTRMNKHDNDEFRFDDTEDDNSNQYQIRWDIDEDSDDLDLDNIPDTSLFNVDGSGTTATDTTSTTTTTTTVTTCCSVNESATVTRVVVVPVERRQLNTNKLTSTTVLYREVETSTQPVKHSLVVSITLTLTIVVTILVVVVVIIVIIRIATQHRHNKQQTVTQGGCTPSCYNTNNRSNAIISGRNNCVLVNSKHDNYTVDSYFPPPYTNGKSTRHQSNKLAADKPLSVKPSPYELMDGIVIDDFATNTMASSNVKSAEALSLIPGRDINHEGPKLVYKWTDF